jgi:hypothetical protein
MGWGRICAGAAVLALTLLTFASCGPLKFKGHNLLLNSIDASEVAGEMTKMASGLNEAMGNEGVEKPAPKSEAKPIFEGGDRWLHFLYIGVVLCALLGVILPGRTFLLLGIAGIVLTAVFMFSFDAWFSRQGEEGEDNPASAAMGTVMSLDWEVGAFVGLGGFLGLAIAGVQGRKRGSSPA